MEGLMVVRPRNPHASLDLITDKVESVKDLRPGDYLPTERIVIVENNTSRITFVKKGKDSTGRPLAIYREADAQSIEINEDGGLIIPSSALRRKRNYKHDSIEAKLINYIIGGRG
jgi:hypothetical protein